MITKITMFTDKECINCAIMEKVMKEYCPTANPVITFNVVNKDNIQENLRPLSYPTFRLYDNQTHSVLRISCGGLEPIKRHITEFQNYLTKHF
tara:strand:+ start:1152 stop:1430 length:279 start_codon:yes stop_codon:yes gene_type:complete